jgi:diaminopimelate epimerase
VHTEGGELKVKLSQTDGGFDDIWLCGPAEKVFEGVIEL